MIKNINSKMTMIILTIFMLASSLLASIQPTMQAEASQSLAMKIVCKFEDGRTLANLQATDYFYYLTRSKSALATVDSVESSVANKLLSVSGYDFVTPNEAILGREIRPSSLPEEVPELNQGPKVSVFDRFGMSGLKWSSYQGEWKYYNVNACAKQNQVSPTNYGAFYENRVEPKSTYDAVNTSTDPRSIQFNRGLASSTMAAAKDLVANLIFSLAKGVVTLTIVFVGLAFTDITSLMGMTADGSAGFTASTMFTQIFNSVFTGFVLFTFMFTALYLLYNGLIRRQARMALGTLAKTIGIFIIAVIMSTNPAKFVSLPNNVATYGQALVLSAMSGIYDNDTEQAGLCTTDIGSIYDGVDMDVNKSESSLTSEFEKVNRNMQSLIGCQMWERLLFRPWVRGQFGADYEDLHDENLNNINEDWVGSPTVPLGDGQSINNWALFHLSAQTDAHSQLGEGNFPTKINGVNADWWRTADALSNYHEEEVPVPNGVGETMVEQVKSEPTKYWQSWVGNNTGERMGAAFIAILFGIAGSAGPLVLSMYSAMYGFVITLLMMTSPLFMLFGTWGGKGEEIFKGWLSTLINMVFKRIGVSILLILSLALTMNIMDLAYTIGIIKAFILMVLITYIFIKNRRKLLDMFGSVDLGGAFNPSTQANAFMQTQNRRAKNVGKVGLAATSGSVTGMRTGQGAARGARIGAQSQLKNTLYQSQMGTQIAIQLDSSNSRHSTKKNDCVQCSRELGRLSAEIAYRDELGNYYCLTCAEDVGVEELYEIEVGKSETREQDEFDRAEDISKSIDPSMLRSKNASMNLSRLKHSEAQQQMKAKIQDGKYEWDNYGVQKMIKDNIKNLRKDTLVFENLRKLPEYDEEGNELYGRYSRPPATPEPLQEYIDSALINQAWDNGNTEVIERTYKEAWKTWYHENGSHIDGLTQDDILQFQEEIEKFEPDIGSEQAQRLIKNTMSDVDYDNSGIENKDLFVYSNGKLRLNTRDINDSINERLNELDKSARQETP